MATVKVVVTALQRYWAAGRCWEGGVTEAVLEDTPERSLASQLAELDAAKGGVRLADSELSRGNPFAQPTPCMLTYRIVEDPPPAPVAYHRPSDIEASERLRDALAPTQAPAADEPEPEAPVDDSEPKQ
jgi:hypothetical protein